MKTVSLDLHDFSVLNNRLDLLLDIKEHYPGFKVSMFMIPLDPRFELSTQKIFRDKFLADIKKNLDWIQIIPHGITHQFGEFENCDFYTFRDAVLPAIDEQFKKDGLPYIKGFCPPNWLWNADVVRALDQAGWWGATDRNQPEMLKTKRNYTYTHSLDERYWESTNDVVNLHGHIDGVSANDLERCFLTLFRLPTDVEWKFATDFIK